MDDPLLTTVEIEKIAKQDLVKFTEVDLIHQSRRPQILEPARISFLLLDFLMISPAQEDNVLQQSVDIVGDIVTYLGIGLNIHQPFPLDILQIQLVDEREDLAAPGQEFRERLPAIENLGGRALGQPIQQITTVQIPRRGEGFFFAKRVMDKPVDREKFGRIKTPLRTHGQCPVDKKSGPPAAEDNGQTAQILPLLQIVLCDMINETIDEGFAERIGNNFIHNILPLPSCPDIPGIPSRAFPDKSPEQY